MKGVPRSRWFCETWETHAGMFTRHRQASLIPKPLHRFYGGNDLHFLNIQLLAPARFQERGLL
jgi:hypothetical protein